MRDSYLGLTMLGGFGHDGRTGLTDGSSRISDMLASTPSNDKNSDLSKA